MEGELRTFSSFTSDDLLLGLGGGIQLMDGAYRGGIAFLFRPSYSPMVHDEDRGKVQYQEKRYAGLLYIERCFAHEHMGKWKPFLGLSGGFAAEIRKGFPDRALIRGLLIPHAGLGRTLFPKLRLEGEYRYAPGPALNEGEHRIGVRLLYSL